MFVYLFILHPVIVSHTSSSPSSSPHTQSVPTPQSAPPPCLFRKGRVSQQNMAYEVAVRQAHLHGLRMGK